MLNQWWLRTRNKQGGAWMEDDEDDITFKSILREFFRIIVPGVLVILCFAFLFWGIVGVILWSLGIL